MSVKSFGNPSSSFRYRFGSTGNRASIPPTGLVFSATGGTKIVDGSYTVHYFTSTNPFNVTSVGEPGTVELILVAGGGGGGSEQGGGAGAGAVIYRLAVPVTVQDYTISIGGGGSGGAGGSGSSGPGTKGTSSTALGFTADGGGRGQGRVDNPPGAGPGGSGGGGSGELGTPGPATGANPHPGSADVESPPSGWGHSGGTYRGGGGGAGASGANSSPSQGPPGGNGGIGIRFSWVSASYGTSGPNPGRYFGGGGGGGAYRSPTQATGGSGGGGAGGWDANIPEQNSAGVPGTTNTGGGGGGGTMNYGAGGTGGSGIVIIRYLT